MIIYEIETNALRENILLLAQIEDPHIKQDCNNKRPSLIQESNQHQIAYYSIE